MPYGTFLENTTYVKAYYAYYFARLSF